MIEDPRSEPATFEWTLVATDDTVAARKADKLVVLDADSGTIRFERTTVLGFGLAMVGPTLVLQELREAGPGEKGGVRYEGAIVGLDPRSGDQRFRVPLAAPHIPNLLTDGELLYFSGSPTASRKATGTAFDTTNGKIVWEVDLPDSSRLVAVDGGKGFVVAPGLLLAMDLANGKVLWQKQEALLGESDHVGAAQGTVYVGAPWRLSAYNADNGNTRWVGESKKARDRADLIYASGDRVIVQSRKIFRYSDPPHPGPGDVGTVVACFGPDGAVIFEQELAIGDKETDRRPASGTSVGGGTLAISLDDHLQLLSLCDATLTDIRLPRPARVASTRTGGATYLMLDNGAVIRTNQG